MENTEPPAASSGNSSLQDWARLEARNDSQAADLLLHTNESGVQKPLIQWRILGLGIACYFALAIVLATLCLCCNSHSTRETMTQTPRHSLVGPKLLTSIDR